MSRMIRKEFDYRRLGGVGINGREFWNPSHTGKLPVYLFTNTTSDKFQCRKMSSLDADLNAKYGSSDKTIQCTPWMM